MKSLMEWSVVCLEFLPELIAVLALGVTVATFWWNRKHAMKESARDTMWRAMDAAEYAGTDRQAWSVAGVRALENVGDRYPEFREEIAEFLTLKSRSYHAGPGTEAYIRERHPGGLAAKVVDKWGFKPFETSKDDT